MITLLNFTKEILRDPLILTRISLRQEYHYTHHLLQQRFCDGGQKASLYSNEAVCEVWYRTGQGYLFLTR